MRCQQGIWDEDERTLLACGFWLSPNALPIYVMLDSIDALSLTKRGFSFRLPPRRMSFLVIVSSSILLLSLLVSFSIFEFYDIIMHCSDKLPSDFICARCSSDGINTQIIIGNLGSDHPNGSDRSGQRSW